MTVFDGLSDEKANALAQQLRGNEVFQLIIDKMLAEALVIVDNPHADVKAREDQTHWRHALQALRNRVEVTVENTGIKPNG